MNFDFLEAIKSLGKDKLCLDYLEWQYSNKYGWNIFSYECCKEIKICWNPEFGKVKIKGSIPYFIAGQNFKTSPEDFKNGIIHLSEVLNIDLMKAEVNVFEFGTTLEIPFSLKEVFASHLKIQGMKTIPFDYGKYFVDKVLKVKLYDAGKNIKNKLKSKDEREKLSLLFGYNPFFNYLKIENHYKKPSICFKRGLIQVNDFMKPEFQSICKEDLLEKYRSIMKAKSIELESKKHINASTIPLIILKEYESLLPCPVEELLKLKIKSFPNDILAKEDKKSRNRQLKGNLKKLTFNNSCAYDLSALVQKKINS